jgi:ribose 5-phosphate isomerase B
VKIYIAADHRGFELKQKLVDFLQTSFEVEDLGPASFVDNDDFVEYASLVASKVNSDLGVTI